MSQRLSQRQLNRQKERPPPGRSTPSITELPVWAEQVQGGKLVKMLQRHVESLRDESSHGNRELFLDNVFVALLLAFFNPTLRTLRTLEDFSCTKQAQRHLSIPRICRSTLSDFNRIAEPQRLRPLIARLKAELDMKTVGSRPPDDLAGVLKQVLAVDGTFLPAAADVAWAVAARNQRAGQKYRARTDWHVDAKTWIPEVLVIPEPGESEADSAARTITPGAIHVYDRGFQSFALIRAHYDYADEEWTQRADFVARLRKPGGNSPIIVVESDVPLSDAARDCGIVSDQVVRLPGLLTSQHFTSALRLVVINLPEGDPVRLLTNVFDVPAEIIGMIYRYRWQVELFFRWLKCYANFNHLISHSKQGVLLNFYVVIIGAMLMYLHSDGRPSKYLFSLLGLVANGGATLEEIMPILRERERQCAVARASAARRRARKPS
jgi:hypothetical protein